MPEAHHRYPNGKFLRGSEIIKFINDWNTCELSSVNVVSREVGSVIHDADKCISSELKRSIESFRLLGVKEFESSTLLNEAALPHGFPDTIKLPLAIWGLLIRILWFSGYKKNVESYREFKERIRKAYNYVNTFANDFYNIAVIGHGLTNMQLKKEMRRDNWRHIENHGGHDYWSFDRFEKKIHL